MLKPKKMQQQTFQNKNDISQSWPRARRIYWILMGILLIEQIKTTDAAQYKDDNCETKSTPGICKEWSECPIIKTLIERGEYTNREVVTCGFGVREELICCPVVRTESKIETTSESTDRFVITSTTTTQKPVRDFWMDLLENQNSTTTTTTAAPDFWLDLLTTTPKPTTRFVAITTTTTTTTMKPLIVGDQRLNESSEFFDFNALLSGNQKRQRDTGGIQQNNQQFNQPNNHQFNQQSNQQFNQRNNQQFNQRNNQQFNQQLNQQNTQQINLQNRGIVNQNNNRRPNIQNGGFVTANNNNQIQNNGVNFNTGPVNPNQWNFEQNPNNQRVNNGRGQQNGGDNNGRGQQNPGFGNNGNNGRGQQNNFRGNNGRGNNSGQNNGKNHNNNGNFRGNNNGNNQNRNFGQNTNQNRGFVFPQDNKRSEELNNFNDDISSNRRPGRPVNNMNEQNPNIVPSTNNPNAKVDDIIKNVFGDAENPNQNIQTNIPQSQNKVVEPSIDDAIKNIFEVPEKPPNNQIFPQQNINNPQPVIWLQPQDNPHAREEYIIPQNPNTQMEFVNGQRPNHFQTIPVIETHDNIPSTNFIQQPVIVETWPGVVEPKPNYDPIQVVYENLVNSGMDIVKVEADNVENVWNQHQQQFQQFNQQQPVKSPQFIQQPLQQFVQQPQQSQQFTQQPQCGQQPSQQFVQQPGQQPFQQFIEKPLQMEPNQKEPRSTQPQQLQPAFEKIPNIQSPPTQILDPFKPFEFRPPPEDESNFSGDNNSLSPNPSKTPPVTDNDRPAVRACRRIEKGLIASLSPHILGGTPAALGEFPHMAAIGYSRVGGDDRPPYDIRCGGTLIDKRFVLTAAHCVSDRESVPSIVRLGVVNFTDVNQMKDAVEIRIKETVLHNDYRTSSTYNDIAILELEREVETSEYVYPACLYTNVTDPDSNLELWVSGWGTFNTTRRSFSNILLKAPLHTTPLERCNQSIVEYGLDRKIAEGVKSSQLCAEDKDQNKDACQGDSGGPLNLIINETYKNFRLVGVITSGFGCASSTPGLYTRVAAYLDFIETIVWPNGGD